LEKARIGNPGSPWPHVWLASAYALKGETDRAAAELAEARGLLGGSAFHSIAAMRAGNWGVPAIRELHEATFSPVCARPEYRKNKRLPLH
jgi:hypothetical protein